jgi:hypothetical protein
MPMSTSSSSEFKLSGRLRVTRRTPSDNVTASPVLTTRVSFDGLDRAVPVVQCHLAARTLTLWGRSSGPVLPRPIGAPDAIAAVAEMLRPA